MTAATAKPASFSEDNSDDLVIARMASCPDARLQAVLASIVRHLHAAVREIEPTEEEWMAAIGFLTETGQMCDDRRQEFILLSDTLGVSMLVDAINNRKSRAATESTVLGPFHVAGAPHRALGETICLDGKGAPLVVSGMVRDAGGAPIPGATLDVWQANDDGFYDVQQPGTQPDMNLRGVFTTDAEGRYWFRSVKPLFYAIPHDGPVGRLLHALGRHPYRPAHIHFIVAASGYRPVTTHIFPEDDPYLDSDAVFGVKDSLILPFELIDDAEAAARHGVANPFWAVEADFVLDRA